MIGLNVTSFTPTLDRLEKRLIGALIVGLQDAAVEVELACIQETVQLEAVDTLAMLEAWYVSLYGSSTYEDKLDMAADAYMNNPTKWEEIRKIFGGILREAPQVESESPMDAWVANAAAHAIFVENGYLSFYGNWVEARPVAAEAERISRPIVLATLQRAVREAMGR